MDFLLYFDFYAPKPTLIINKQDSVKTYLGSILSLITIIILVLILIFIIFCLINDTGLTIIIYSPLIVNFLLYLKRKI